MSAPFIHPLADVQAVNIGEGTRIWQYCVVLPGARVGRDCNICAHVFIENAVIVGDNVTVKSGVQLWDGVTIESDVFIGPNATFTNDPFPRSKHHLGQAEGTLVKARASIGANATILPGLVIGTNAMVAAGSVVTRSVPANAIVAGSPAAVVGYAASDQTRLREGCIPEAKRAFAVENTKVKGVGIYHLPVVTDIRGSIAIAEFGRHLPFLPNRYFMVFGVPNRETRGEHAHRKCHQFLLCVHGSCSVVTDDGVSSLEVVLNNREVGLYLPPMTWAMQYKFSPDALLVVFASEFYESEDYIRDYAEFKSCLNG